MFCSKLQIKESLDRESKNKALLHNQNIILKKQMCPEMIYDAKNMKNVVIVIPQCNNIFPKCSILYQTWSIYVEIALDFDLPFA